MAKPEKIAGNPEIDPTLPKIEIKLGKETFFLCFTFGALALAQKNLRSIGVDCNLLHALDLSSLDASQLVPLLYAAMISHQPKISVDKVISLVTIENLGLIFDGIAHAYGASLADPSPEDVKPDPNQPEV
ncbi:MAG: hypothetical protein JWQ49_4560 [Edaphobacter sp.]|nr:hypothetical protein [Edaphobacter sp.]